MTKSACLKTTRGRVSTQEQVVCFDFLNYDFDDHNVAVFMSCDFYHISKFFTKLVISEKINKLTGCYVGKKKYFVLFCSFLK